MADQANSNLARGIAGIVKPEDVEPGYERPGCRATAMRSGAGEANQESASADPYWDEERPRDDHGRFTRKDT